MPKKIVLVISSLGGGGAESILVRMSKYLCDLGYNVVFVTLDFPVLKEKHVLDPKIKRVIIFYRGYSFSSKMYSTIKRFIALRRLIKTEKPFVVLSFMTPTNILTIIATIGLNVKCIVSERTDPSRFSYGYIYDFLTKSLYRFSDKVIVQTEAICNFLRNRYKADISIIPNFINNKSEVILPRLEKRIIAVGRLVDNKNFRLLIFAFYRLRKSFPEWTLHIIGEGEQRQNLENLILSLELNNKVILHGYVSNPFPMLMSSSLFVQTSIFEGFPNVLLEAMSCGLPVISTEETGYMLIKHNVNGLLFPSGDIDQLVLQLNRLMLNNNLRESLGLEALKVRVDYHIDKIMAQWLNVLFS